VGEQPGERGPHVAGLLLPYGLTWLVLASAMRATQVDAPTRRAVAVA